MLQTTTQKNDVDLIVETLRNKSKRTMTRNIDRLRKQARYFSPFYRDFIHKLLKNSYLKIVHESRSGYVSSIESGEVYNSLSKRQVCKLSTDISDVKVLPHELGHAIDFWFGRTNSLTSSVLLSNGQTFREIFDAEFNEKKEALYKMVMDEYINIINSNINENAYETLMANMDTYRCLKAIPEKNNSKEERLLRKKLQMKLYESGFMDTYLQLHLKKCPSILNKKYSPILDALSSQYDFEGLSLDYHKYMYYQEDPGIISEEFFANCFGAEVTSELHYFSKLMEHMPKSFSAFQELFNIIYTHIQSNKRFTDVKIKVGGTINA